jgi:DNA-directed RNA polymerase III subunit RPC2
MIELLGSKAAVNSGRFHYGTAFGEPSGESGRKCDTTPALSMPTVCDPSGPGYAAT